MAGSVRDYSKRHPGPADIALLVEVADWSLQRDRHEKAPLYARAGIQVYWIVNLAESIVEVFKLPTAGGQYPPPQCFGVGDAVPLMVGGQILSPIPVNEILP